MVDRTKPVIIVGGCGTFGLSTAWHLARRGYTNITCLDRWMFPSRSSAGFDRNKIVRTNYTDPLYTKLALEALHQWKQPLFNDIFHQTGWVTGTTCPPTPAGQLAERTSNSISVPGTFDAKLHTLRLLNATDGVTDIPNSQALNQSFPQYFSHAPNFRGYFDKNAGWVDAAKALEAVGHECQALGVQFHVGPQGTVKSILRSKKSDGDVTGVLTEDGTVWRGDKVILCLGAYTESLIDMEGQVTAVAYSTAHVALTPEETERYRNMPVMLMEAMGYAFPPDKTGHIKFCDLHVGHPWKHKLLDRPGLVSIPRDVAYHANDTLPDEDVTQVREFIRYCMPQFATRKFDRTAMCWDCESFDYSWIVGPHPSSPNHLYLATAGSGHTFKNLPNAGKYVADCLEGSLAPELRETWRWRPEKVNSIPETERVDLADLHGWQHDSSPNTSLSLRMMRPKL